MALPPVGPLDELGSLDRSLLHLFVTGPGEGEGLAIALPATEWLLVDGSRARRQGNNDAYPVLELVRRFRSAGDSVDLVFTHPHRDHCWGIPELIEELAPRTVATVGTDRPGATLVAEVDALEAAFAARTTAQAVRRNQVLQALRAIESWCDPTQQPSGRLISLHDGIQLPLRSDAVAVYARSPVLSWLTDQDLVHLATDRPNAMSTVLEVVFGNTSLILGADLPERDHHGIVPSGWTTVLQLHPRLVHHHGWKVPHHGSREALHPDLVGAYPRSRAWCLTPFNSSSLPRTDDADGLDQLVRGQSPVHLTSLPLSKSAQAAVDDGRVTPSELAEAIVHLGRGDRFQQGDTVWHAGTGTAPLDAVWHVAFDDEGQVVARHRGAAAVEVFARAPAAGAQ